MIKLFDGWVISADELNYVLKQEKGMAINKETGEEKMKYSTPLYYRTIDECATSLCRIYQRKAVKERDYSLLEARTALNGIREMVQTVFDGIDVVGRDLTEGESV